MEGAKAMATISSVKFNVYRNAATKLTLHYCRKWKSPRKSVRKKRGTRKTRFSPGLRLELDCTQTNEIRTIRTSSQLLRTSVILQLHVDLKTEFLCEIFPPPPLLWCWRRRRRRNSVRHFLGQIRFQTLHWDTPPTNGNQKSKSWIYWGASSLIFVRKGHAAEKNWINVVSDICSQKRDSGICPGNVPRFYFDKTLGQCQLFSYGGCGGNSNNFEALDQCVAHCGGTREDVFQVSRLTGIHY